MSQRSTEKFRDFLTWFNEHKRDSMGVPERLTFLETAFDCLAMNVVDLLEDITDLEGRPKESLGRRIWTTQGMTLSGSLKRFG